MLSFGWEIVVLILAFFTGLMFAAQSSGRRFGAIIVAKNMEIAELKRRGRQLEEGINEEQPHTGNPNAVGAKLDNVTLLRIEGL